METKSLPFRIEELKASGTGWEVAGYASTFGGTPDTYGDIVAKGAFLDSIAKRKTRLLWQHNIEKPIGKQLDLKEDEHGLFGRWSIVPTSTGKEAHELLSAELIDSMSIGFMTNDAEYRDDGVRVLKAIDLFEVSLVTVPANSSAVITSFKSPDDIPLFALLKREAEALRFCTAEVKALRSRRAAAGRAPNDRTLAAEDEFLAEAEALLAELKAARTVSPQAEASAAEIERMRLSLRLARAKINHRRTA